MVFLNKFLATVYLAVVYASTASAFTKYSTHRTRDIGSRGFQVEAYHPESNFETFSDGLEQPATFVPLSLAEASVDFVKTRLGVDSSKVSYKSGFTSKSTKVGYVKQAHKGVTFANAVANVAWKNNRVVSFGSSFVKTDKIAASTPSVTVESVIRKAEEVLEGKYNGHPAALEYLARPDGSVALTHVVQIQNEEAGTWYEAFVDAHSGEILTVTDFVTDATVGSLNNSGNNVIAFKGSQSTGLTVQNGEGLFNYTYDDARAPTEGQNVDAARTNAFYVINAIHDFAYRYGFTETAFNFQTNNFGKGGKGNDRVIMSVQDSSGTNNANFATPADGQSGTCRMYVWTQTPVRRDGSLDNDIIVHEMTHGITNRMTGGGTGRCLQTTEAGGMGEGWSDALAEWTEQKSGTIEDYVLASYVTNNPAGIRTHPYSTNVATNPLRYSSVATLSQVHRIGEVWANLLHNVYAALVEAHGWSSTARTNPDGTEGNVVYLHLFIDALALQPCNPTFVSARDAWIQADVNRYGGANACLLWKAFASRGLGVKAAKFIDDSTVPPACL